MKFIASHSFAFQWTDSNIHIATHVKYIQIWNDQRRSVQNVTYFNKSDFLGWVATCIKESSLKLLVNC